MYQLILEWILGVKRENDTLSLSPCVPSDWPSFTLRYRFKETFYNISVVRSTEEGAAPRTIIDGNEQKDGKIHLVNDLRDHTVHVEIP